MSGSFFSFWFLFLVSLIASTALTAIQAATSHILPGPDIIAELINLAFSVTIITTIFALIYKFLPDVHISWRSVWRGAGITTVLFLLGKYAIGVYLGTSNVASTYGAAGSVIILFLWIYYSAQIFLFGAEFTQVYAQSVGDFPKIKENAEQVPRPKHQVTSNIPAYR